jgi:hypothetical protein
VGCQTRPFWRDPANGCHEGGEHLGLDVGGPVQASVGERPGGPAESGEKDTSQADHPSPLMLGTIDEFPDDGVPKVKGHRRVEQ